MIRQQDPAQLMHELVQTQAQAASPVLTAEEQEQFTRIIVKLYVAKLKTAGVGGAQIRRALPLMGATREFTEQIAQALWH